MNKCLSHLCAMLDQVYAAYLDVELLAMLDAGRGDITVDYIAVDHYLHPHRSIPHRLLARPLQSFPD